MGEEGGVADDLSAATRGWEMGRHRPWTALAGDRTVHAYLGRETL